MEEELIEGKEEKMVLEGEEEEVKANQSRWKEGTGEEVEERRAKEKTRRRISVLIHERRERIQGIQIRPPLPQIKKEK